MQYAVLAEEDGHAEDPRAQELAERPAPKAEAAQESRAAATSAHVVNELVTTERQYVKDLALMLALVADWTSGGEPILSRAEARQIFPGIESLHLVHNNIVLPAVESAVASKHSVVAGVAAVFTTHSHVLRLYIDPTKGLPSSQAMVRQLLQSRPEFKQAVDEATRAHNLSGLDSLLVKPFQRVLKYPLLFRELLNSTPQSAPEHAVVSEALLLLQNTARSLNEKKRDSEMRLRVVELQMELGESLPGGLVQASRFLLLEDVLVQLRDGKRANQSGVNVYLMNDLLVVRKVRAMSVRGGWVHTVPLDNLVVRAHHGVDSVLAFGDDRDSWEIVFVVEGTDLLSKWTRALESLGVAVQLESSATFRSQWRGSWAFPLALAFAMMHLKQFWMIPALCVRHGYSLFLALYVICLGIVMVPVAVLEGGLGHTTQSGGVRAWSRWCGRRSSWVGCLAFLAALQNATLSVRWLWAALVGVVYVAQGDDAAGVAQRGVSLSTSPLMLVPWLVCLVALFVGIEKGLSRCLVALAVVSLVGVLALLVEVCEAPGEGSILASLETTGSKATGSALVDAFALASVTMNVGTGAMATVGSHMPRRPPVSANRLLRTITIAVVVIIAVSTMILFLLPVDAPMGDDDKIPHVVAELLASFSSASTQVLFLLGLASAGTGYLLVTVLAMCESVREPFGVEALASVVPVVTVAACALSLAFLLLPSNHEFVWYLEYGPQLLTFVAVFCEVALLTVTDTLAPLLASLSPPNPTHRTARSSLPAVWILCARVLVLPAMFAAASVFVAMHWRTIEQAPSLLGTTFAPLGAAALVGVGLLFFHPASAELERPWSKVVTGSQRPSARSLASVDAGMHATINSLSLRVEELERENELLRTRLREDAAGRV